MESLSLRRSGHLAEIELTSTLLGPAFWRELPEVFHALDDDPEVRAAVLCAAGDHFSYGLDLQAMLPQWDYALERDARAGPRYRFREEVRRLQRAITAVAACRKPVVAAIWGWCVGGGVDLAAATDIRIASADARFSVRETRLGVVADTGSLQRLRGIVSEGSLRRLALTGEDVGAERAAQIGLVDEVHADRDATLAAARELAQRIAANPPLVVQGTKHILDFDREPRVRDGLEYVATWNAAFLASDDFDEAIRAFHERREPQFRGS